MHDNPEHIYRAIKAGAKGYLLKESAGQEVIRAIRLVQKGGNYLSQKVADKMTDKYIAHQTRGAQRSLDHLSTREKETLRMVVEGKSSIEISKKLNLSKKTVETYRSRIMHKLGIHDVPGLVKYAIQQGITSLEE
jgi:DNA-binding NarL/FixJ family response regulator